MKPKPSEVLTAYPSFGKWLLSSNITHYFESQQDAQNWLDELNRLREYKKKLEIAKNGLRMVVNFDTRYTKYDDTAEIAVETLKQLEDEN